MNATQKQVGDIAIRSCISILCCAVVGYIFYQERIFNRHIPTFTILVYGIIGSIFFQILRVNVRNAWAAFLLLFIANTALITHSTRIAYLVRDVFYCGALALALVLFFRIFYHKGTKDRWTEPLILAALLSVFTLVALSILMILHKALHNLTFIYLYTTAKLYFLTGLGLGMGIILTEDPYRTRILKFFHSFYGSDAGNQ